MFDTSYRISVKHIKDSLQMDLTIHHLAAKFNTHFYIIDRCTKKKNLNYLNKKSFKRLLEKANKS